MNVLKSCSTLVFHPLFLHYTITRSSKLPLHGVVYHNTNKHICESIPLLNLADVERSPNQPFSSCRLHKRSVKRYLSRTFFHQQSQLFGDCTVLNTIKNYLQSGPEQSFCRAIITKAFLLFLSCRVF